MTRIAARGVDKIEAQLHDEVARGRQLGLDVALVGPDEATRLMPYLVTDGVRAVMHMRSDVYLEPVQLPLGYARASARLGAVLLPNTPVEEILIDGGTVVGVRTPGGEIRAPAVVDAAGAWLRAVAAQGGATVKAVATRHQLMVTPLPKVQPNQRITRIIDANLYVRPERGGLMLGGYEPDPVQYRMEDLSANFQTAGLPLDLAVLRRLADSVAAQFPVFRGVALQEHRGGLPTMTADGELLAEWITTGRPSIAVPSMSPSRMATGHDAGGAPG